MTNSIQPIMYLSWAGSIEIFNPILKSAQSIFNFELRECLMHFNITIVKKIPNMVSRVTHDTPQYQTVKY